MKGDADADITLITPPIWLNSDHELDFPPLGNPTLAGVLRSAGHLVKHLDLNADFFQFFINHIHIDELIVGSFTDADKLSRSSLSYLIRDWLRVWNEKLKPETLPEAMKISFREFVESHLSQLFEAITHPSNPFRVYLENCPMFQDLLQTPCPLVGISILSPDQAFSGLTVASFLRQYKPEATIVLGGPWATLFAAKLLKIDNIRDLIDAVVVGEGEYAISGLAAQKQDVSAKRWGDIPNLLYLSEGKATTTAYRQTDLDVIPAPDFSDLDLNLYTFKQTITYQTSRGCYWGRCVFCEHIHGCHLQHYRQRNMDLVLADLEKFSQEGIQRVIFSDAAFLPGRLETLSRGILERGLDLEWWAFVRPEKTFTAEHFSLASQAGCKWLNFGLETVNSRVVDKMQRGSDLDYSGRVFELCARQGIKVLVGAIIRLPTESEAEAAETLNFLLKHQNSITRPSVNLFNLQRNSYIEKHPEEFGLKILESGDEALCSHLRYDSGQSLGEARANEMIRHFKSVWGRKNLEQPPPDNLLDRVWSCESLSAYKLRFENFLGADSAGLYLAVSLSDGKPNVCRVGETDVGLLAHMKQSVTGRQFARALSETLNLSLEDSELLAENQVARYVQQGLIAPVP